MSTLEQSINNLIKHLKNDPDYYNTWKSNIAMAFYDECNNTRQFNDIHTVSNKAAERFLKLLMDQSELESK